VLLDARTLEGIREGRIRLQFRRWRRPTVRAGGTLLTAMGQLAIDEVDAVDWNDVTEAEARSAGFQGRSELLEALGAREGTLYRVSLRPVGPDPRIELRARLPTDEELTEIEARLDRWDRASPVGPWTRTALALIAERPAVLAASLAKAAGQDRDRFKTNVRKLKGLGLTESLEVGYRLSPRGVEVHRRLVEQRNPCT